MDSTRLPTLPEPETVTLDGAAIATWTLEPDSSPAGDVVDVVLCHGTPWSAQVWTAVAEQLRAGRRIHLWDMPGYGLSSKEPEVRIDLAAQMARFAALLEHRGLRRPHVVAHDIGGAVALGAHLLHGQEFASLALWDAVTLDPWGSPFFQLVAEHTEVFAALPPALHGALVREYIAGAGREFTAEQLETLTLPWIDDAGRPAFYRQIAALSPEHTRPVVDRLGELRCPAMIGWGAEDPWIPAEQADRLAAALPGEPTVEILDGVGHLTPVEAPEPMARVLDDWLPRG